MIGGKWNRQQEGWEFDVSFLDAVLSTFPPGLLLCLFVDYFISYYSDNIPSRRILAHPDYQKPFSQQFSPPSSQANSQSIPIEAQRESAYSVEIARRETTILIWSFDRDCRINAQKESQ
jgi:hypothetical protein